MKNRIRELRKEKNMTLKQLSEKLGIASNTLSQCQLPQSKDMGLVTHDLTVSGNNATSLLPHYTWLHHWVVGSTHLTNTFTH